MWLARAALVLIATVLTACASGPRTIDAEVRTNAAQPPGHAVLQGAHYRFERGQLVAGQPDPAKLEAMAQTALAGFGAAGRAGVRAAAGFGGGSTGAITSAAADALTGASAGAAAATTTSGFAAITAVRAVRLRCASAAASCRWNRTAKTPWSKRRNVRRWPPAWATRAWLRPPVPPGRWMRSTWRSRPRASCRRLLAARRSCCAASPSVRAGHR